MLLLITSFLCAFNLHKSSPEFITQPIPFESNHLEHPSERAIEWLIHLEKVSYNYPKTISQQLAVAQKLWSNKYPCKGAVISLTRAEVDKTQGKHKSASNHALRAIKMLEASMDVGIHEKKLLSLAYIAFAKYSENIKGLTYAYKAVELSTKIDFRTGEVLAHNQIGLIMDASKNDFVLALDHFNKAKDLLPLLPTKGRHFIKSYILGNIATIWSDLGNIQKSIDYKLQVLENEDNINHPRILITNHNKLGANYYELKQYDLAEKHLQKTLDLIDQHQVFTYQGISLLRMGLIQLEKGYIKKANSYAEAIDSWLVNYQFVNNNKVHFYQFKSKIAKASADFDQAIFWIKKAAVEQDSINKITNSNNLIQLEGRNKYQEIEQEKETLEKEKQLSQAIIHREKIILVFAMFIVLLSTYFSIITYRGKNEIIYSNLILPSIKNKTPEQAPSTKKSKVITSSINKINTGLKQKILIALVEDKLFLSQDLTLKRFADHLNSNTSYVSKTINEGFGKNFNALINDYRIDKVIELFQEGQHRTFTIESIYKKAGFKSKSSFQKAFKTKIGLTASDYLTHVS